MASKSNSLNAATTSEDVAKQISALQADIAALTETVSGYGKTKAAELRGAAETKASELRERGAEHAEAMKAHAADLNAQANDFVAKQPATALGIAAGVGFLIGYMSSRR